MKQNFTQNPLRSVTAGYRHFFRDCERSRIMAHQLMRAVPRLVARRAFSTSLARAGGGAGGMPAWQINPRNVYEDRPDFPMPNVPYVSELDDAQKALKAKEAGDWKSLSDEELKALYRLKFHKSMAEMEAPTGEWKTVVGGTSLIVALTLVLYIIQKKYAMPEMPASCNYEWQEAMVKKQLQMRNNPVEGLASKWDYENNKWK
ncbi:cytochrome c oxidase subunit 4 isoform 1, mitochondrial-like isoform X2 [Branchiostoma floridae x Branchiostoma japonicum]